MSETFKFSSDLPTEPGFYAWAPDRVQRVEVLQVEWWGAAGALVTHARGVPPGNGAISVQTRGGLWCRMVPAQKPAIQHPLGRSVLQDWVAGLPMMQQTVLLTGIRGPDGQPKYGSVKMLLRWFRRCVLLSAMDGAVLDNPWSDNGGSFTGPSLPAKPFLGEWEKHMNAVVDEYMRTLDALPMHFQMHLMHAAEILGYKHPDDRISYWWHSVYVRLVESLHLHPETKAEMDSRLGDSRSGWLKRADPATVN